MPLRAKKNWLEHLTMGRTCFCISMAVAAADLPATVLSAAAASRERARLCGESVSAGLWAPTCIVKPDIYFCRLGRILFGHGIFGRALGWVCVPQKKVLFGRRIFRVSIIEKLGVLIYGVEISGHLLRYNSEDGSRLEKIQIIPEYILIK